MLLPILLLLGGNSSKAEIPANWPHLHCRRVAVRAGFCLQRCPLKATASLLVWPSWHATCLQQRLCPPHHLVRHASRAMCRSRAMCSRQLQLGMQPSLVCSACLFSMSVQQPGLWHSACTCTVTKAALLLLPLSLLKQLGCETQTSEEHELLRNLSQQ